MSASSLELSTPSTEAVSPRQPWTTIVRIGFRITFLYFAAFVFLNRNGNLFQVFPVVGGWINHWLLWIPDHTSVWIGQHLFHLTGPAAHWHPTGSGDTTLNWIEAALYLAVALTGGLAWSLWAELRRPPRTEYTTLSAWLRFLLRLTCGGFMLLYGFSKVFPLQMAPISIAILNEPVGNMSPMTMLWALIGLHPLYEVVCGAAEVIGGVLILFRRTALLGALVSAFVMTNVALYNFFFDVPVKIFSLELLLACLYLAVPDLKALWFFFWRHQPAALGAMWIPPATRRWARITLRVVEVAFTLVLLILIPVLIGLGWRQNRIASRTASPLLGAWSLDAAHPASGAFITADGAPATNLYVDTVIRAFTRSADGELWRTRLEIDAKAHTLQIAPYGGKPEKYSWQMPDAQHLLLTSLPPPAPKTAQAAGPAFKPEIVALTRIPVPAHYPLLDRGFHLVNQWGYER